ncbi:Major Facilitator Superfamily protein [Aspergillus parasiticus SU-1]|uniref:Major Facilitator Superfamily protein n=1 Tax=Aspergillus parasiticus (strain ATCC 56775 / NRRL 5862 / SRRC 143 / SU-1) TaxID=1403190 RepID=A0A0F0ILN9_ASPPU|nr:Major Facilitator Superfamily protein [Aspergillus parasiticus SU-1]
MDLSDVEGQTKDISSHEIENVNTEAASFTPEEEKALVRKVDLTLLPTIWVMYLLSYLDRTNIGNAKISGMEVDLNLSSNQYSIALVVFFVGYVVFEVPSNLVLGRSRPSIFLPSIMILWGALTCVMAVVKSFTHLVVLRVILGCVEAGFAPGVLLVLSSWYKQTEQSKRFGVFISAAVLSGAFGGLIAAGIVDGLEGVHGIRGWRWLFIIEGAATVGFAIISLFILPDFPATSRRFSEREKQVAVARLATENVTATTEDTEHLSPLAACKVACQNWRTWAFIIGYMVIVGSSTLTYFYPTLVEGLFGNASTKKVNLLTVPIYGVAFFATGITSYYSDKVPTWRGLIIASWLTVSLICSVIVCAVYNFTARYILLVIMAAGLWATNGGTLAYASSAFAGMHPQARGVALAMVNALGNLAQIYGSYLFPKDDSPKYIMGFSVISAMLAVGVVVFLFLHIWFRRHLREGIIQ